MATIRQEGQPLSRREFLIVGGATAAAALEAMLLMKLRRSVAPIAGNTSSNDVDRNNPQDDLWGRYRVGEANLGEIQGINVIEGDSELKNSIENQLKRELVNDPNIAFLEVVGKENNALLPIAWTKNNDDVVSRWTIWSRNDKNEIIPVNGENTDRLESVEVSKIIVDGTPIIGPARSNQIEPFFVFIKNVGWEVRLPYKNLNPNQGPIPVKQIPQNLQEFLTK